MNSFDDYVFVGTVCTEASEHDICSLRSCCSSIRKSVTDITNNFFLIGKALCHISDNKLYAVLGYSSISAFAKSEFGFSKVSTSRFVKVYRRFFPNCDYSSFSLCAFSFRQLVELAGFSDDEIINSGVTPDVSVRSIKSFVSDAIGTNVKNSGFHVETSSYNSVTFDDSIHVDMSDSLETLHSDYKKDYDTITKLTCVVDSTGNSVSEIDTDIRHTGTITYIAPDADSDCDECSSELVYTSLNSNLTQLSKNKLITMVQNLNAENASLKSTIAELVAENSNLRDLLFTKNQHIDSSESHVLLDFNQLTFANLD